MHKFLPCFSWHLLWGKFCSFFSFSFLPSSLFFLSFPISSLTYVLCYCFYPFFYEGKGNGKMLTFIESYFDDKCFPGVV